MSWGILDVMNAKGWRSALVYTDSETFGGYALGYLGYFIGERLGQAVLLVWSGPREEKRLVGMTSTPRGTS